MIKIVSAKFKTDSYNNGDAATWDKKMKECDKISASLEKGCSDLLTSCYSWLCKNSQRKQSY